MELAGIEPASARASRQPSTCVFDQVPRSTEVERGRSVHHPAYVACVMREPRASRARNDDAAPYWAPRGASRSALSGGDAERELDDLFGRVGVRDCAVGS